AGGGIVSFFGPHIQPTDVLVFLRTDNLDLNFSPGAVVGRVSRSIAEDILVLQLRRDLLADIRHFRRRERKERAAAGHLGQLDQRITASSSRRIQNSDGIQLNILFTDVIADIAEAVSAAVVFAVGDQEERLFGIVALLKLIESQVYRIVERRAAL